MSDNLTPSQASEPFEITEITRTGQLPDSRLIPMDCCRAASEMLTYNRHELTPPMTMLRLRERDCFVLGDQRITLSVSVLDYGFCGALFVTLVNNTENRERSKSKLLPFSLGTIGLPISSATDDLMYRSEDASIDFLRAPDKWYIRIYIDRFDDVRSLYVNATVEDISGDCAFSAVPVGKKNNRFLLRHGSYAMPVSGKMVLGAEVYELAPEETLAWLERERSDSGRIPEHSRISLSGYCGDIPFGLCASDSGVFTTENTLIFDRKAYHPEELTVQREDGAWFVSTPDEHIQLYLPISASRTDRIKLAHLAAERNREYGLCLGELVMFGQRYVVSSGIGCGEHILSKC